MGCGNTLHRISPKFITSISKGTHVPPVNADEKEGGNVFDDQIRVGVGISFFIKKAEETSESADVWNLFC